ncbi:FixH family protein [Robertmurraya korlensis]|uniref:FixH family protein n=1 Tax=Robertmurraya korlensis TaxID=519977 RepID=UPI00203DCAB9|nr:FixH family protein [Robertmurraya korlensis]MCM3603458.1 FixH family protein [Robertmurraya korlensis]
MHNMKNVFLIAIIGLLLGGCSLKEDAVELYLQEQPIHAEVVLPETIMSEEQVPIKVILTQDGKKVEEVDTVEFEMWKHDDDIHATVEQPDKLEEGIYGLNKTFESDGLYYIKIHASKGRAIIMPQFQVVVGELSKSELEFLQKDVREKEEGHDHHH